MARDSSDATILRLREAAIPLSAPDGAPDDVTAIVQRIGDARVVLLGEASHGTHEFYALRAAVTRRLVETRGFRAVTIEGDWPDARRVDRYVRGAADDPDAAAALDGFRRFPQWMWRNGVMRDFVSWLRARNGSVPAREHCGVYGLDLYSLHASIDAVLRYLGRVDPRAAARARERYACFELTPRDEPHAYGAGVERGGGESCEEDVVRQLAELRHCADEYRSRDGAVAEDDFFSAEQNARLVANAERYYRAMFRGRVASWNLRDTHMAETLAAVLARLEREGDRGRACVWAHNSHLGDARATEMGRGGEINLGQLVRERFGGEACLVGATTWSGTVTAAHDWDEPGGRRDVVPALPESVEALLHAVGLPAFLLDLREPAVAESLATPRLERAIGVIYRPETERQSHYFEATLPRQFDLLVHLDRTTELKPLERPRAWDGEEREVPETYPSAL